MNTHDYIENIGKLSADAKKQIAVLSLEQKNNALLAIAKFLRDDAEKILKANEEDVAFARENGISDAMIDRLSLSHERIEGMAKGTEDVAKLPDPIGKELNRIERPNGIVIRKIRVPMGVIGIIFEARPNVTSDSAALCLKAGSAVILRGGKSALKSNTAIVKSMKNALKSVGLNDNIISFVEDTSRESADEMMRLTKHIDCLIPRGGAGLINSVVKNATVPVIKTGTGNCHAYIDEFADSEKAVNIIVNAKCSRVSVCNALESIVIHKSVIKKILPQVVDALISEGVEIFGDDESIAVCPEIKKASEEDFYTEYLDYKISVKTVGSSDEAIDWINEHSTMHSETIITEDSETAAKFLQSVDSSSVYHNVSTRFTDGGEFGLGAEIGISTQKLHARGPMGLEEIATYKYVITGNGQTR